MLGSLGIGRAAKGTVRALTLRGSVITVTEMAVRQALGLGSNLVLAWLLSPGVFGLMALVQVVLRGLKMFSDVGIGPSIIQHARGEDPVFLNTAWTIQALRGVFLWLGASLFAWPAAVIYGAPQLLVVLPVAAFALVITGFNSTTAFTLQRKLSWAPMVIVGLIAQVASIVVMIALAWWWRNVWALVAGWFVTAVIMLIGTHVVGERRAHRLAWDRSAVHELFRFGRWIFVSTLLTFLAGQLDRLLLGGLVTLEELGVYSLATAVVLLPGAVCWQLSSVVLFPALASSARRRPDELGTKIRMARNVILPGSLVAMLCVVLGAPVLFGYLYDRRYDGAAWISQGLAVGAWFGILQMSADRALLALGDSRALALSNAVKLVVTGATSVLGFAFLGLAGFILGLATGSIAGHAVVQWALRRHGIRLIGQDTRYTLLAMGIGAFGAVVPRIVAPQPNTTLHLAAILITAAVCLVPCGLWATRRTLHEIFPA